MVERRVCTFCGIEIEPGTGRMYVKKDGVIYNFCSSKCFKNLVELGRVPRRTTWTRFYDREKQIRKKATPEATPPTKRKAKKVKKEESEAEKKAGEKDGEELGDESESEAESEESHSPRKKGRRSSDADTEGELE